MNLTNSSNKKSWKALSCQVSTLNFNIAGPGLQSQLLYFIIVNSSLQDTMVTLHKKYEKLFLLLSNYWMRLSMISWIIKTNVWGSIICDIMGQPNSIIVLLYIFQTAKEDTSLSLLKYENTTQMRGLETRQTLKSTWWMQYPPKVLHL